MRKITKRSLAITTAAVVAVGGGAAAWAAWSVSNHATASVKSGSATPVQIVNAALTGPLIPGPGTGVQFRINNPNPFPIRVTAATLTGFNTDKPGCDDDNFVAGTGAFTPIETIGANGGTNVVWANAIKLKNSPHTDCQNADVTFEVNVTAESKDS
jgi:hypothetical protein